MNPGPQAIRLGNTLYRTSEISWLKVQRLTMWEMLANGLMILSGIIFILAMNAAKGTFMSLEALLGLLPICLGLSVHGDARLASTGDTQDSYFDRGLGMDVNIKELARSVRDSGNMMEFTGDRNAYYYLINPNRVAWVSSWFTINAWPLVMAALFVAYAWMLPHNWHVPSLNTSFLKSLHLLDYAPGTLQGLIGASFFCALAGVLSLAASIKQGIVIGAIGGVADTLHMWAADRQRLFETVSGSQPAPAVEPAPQVSTMPLEVSQ
ncbi:MAG: hypothetical protein ACYCW6_28685 [Candidatus Xenobia bacterium]